VNVPKGRALESMASSSFSAPEWIWRNGELVPWAGATIHVNAVGHASVSAVFEGIKAYRAAEGDRLFVFRLDEHLRRLLDSARICRLAVAHDLADLRTAIVDLVQANGYQNDTYIRPWVFPAGLVREQLLPAWVECEVVVDTWAFSTALASGQGCRAAVSSWLRVSDSSSPPRVKAFSNYHNGRLALMEARENGHDWPILLNEQHKVAEGPGACIALVRDGVVATPALSDNILPGITRDTALTLLAEAGVPVQERTVDRSELYLADEIFFMGTAWEILPVTTVDGLPVGGGTPGPIATALRERYAGLVRGREGDTYGWLTEIPVKARP
jgi:branched-chain amino acid aminotransferase